ncbi:protein shisa-5 isoform X2 [Linepithema humile]|uniref:protein shisa-5 isoform X2 n=1 Tax=Linepithema humile TaxID=83485 RepID=UPI0006233AFD|nr:PREDICTED: protein shisa-5-like isoform X2 [Linepithema humile]
MKMNLFRHAVILIIVHAAALICAAMECPVGEKNSIIDKVTGSISRTCPRTFDPPEKSYCCFDIQREYNYCCTVEEFAKSGLSMLILVIIGAAIIFGLIVCCVSCLCCSCCPWYRRRHRGTVYGKVQPPVVQVIQPQNLPPSYPSQPVESNYTSPYPTNSTGMPQPPPYTNEAYAKQAAYNPAYPAPQ